MIAGLLFIGLVLGLACAWIKPDRPPFPREFSNWGLALGWAGLACWTVAFVDLFMRVA